ncbi:MAG: DUF1778 domain-containing protein [Frankia sp.]
MTMAAAKDDRIQVRLPTEQGEMIRSAAEIEGKTLTDFAVESMAVRARHVLADRRMFWLSSEAWVEFNALLDEPPVSNPELAVLLADDSFFA